MSVLIKHKMALISLNAWIPVAKEQILPPQAKVVEVEITQEDGILMTSVVNALSASQAIFERKAQSQIVALQKNSNMIQGNN